MENKPGNVHAFPSSPAEPAPTDVQIEAAANIVWQAIRNQVDGVPEQIRMDATPHEFGIDSLDFVEIVMNLEEELTMDFETDPGMTENHTVREIATHVAKESLKWHVARN